LTTRKPAIALLVALVLVHPGCGTLLGLATERDVFIITNPSGANLFANGSPCNGALSPTTVALDPAEEWRVDARLDDLKGGTQITRSRRIGVVIADVVFTVGLGLWIDYLSGAMYYFPDRVILNLGKSEFSPSTLAASGPEAPATTTALDPNDRDPVAADPAWPAANTGGPPPKGDVKGGKSTPPPQGGDSSTRDLLGTNRR
jgi:hypothetical protein